MRGLHRPPCTLPASGFHAASNLARLPRPVVFREWNPKYEYTEENTAEQKLFQAFDDLNIESPLTWTGYDDGGAINSRSTERNEVTRGERATVINATVTTAGLHRMESIPLSREYTHKNPDGRRRSSQHVPGGNNARSRRYIRSCGPHGVGS
jgi:hypothetical protein